jgi:hypothetical protein
VIEINSLAKNQTEVSVGDTRWLISYRTLAAGIWYDGTKMRFCGIDSSRTTNRWIYEFLGRGRKEIETVSEDELIVHCKFALVRHFFPANLLAEMQELKELTLQLEGIPGRVGIRIQEIVKHLEETVA